MSKPKRNTAKMPSQRQLRIAELIRHGLSQILLRGDIHDPELGKYTVTVPEVRVSPDLKLASVYIMPLGGEGAELVIARLKNHTRYLRGEIARHINLRHAPNLRFFVDDTFDEADRITKLLNLDKVKADLEKKSEPDDAEQQD
jgi:ribosome-binding factor A